MTINLSEAKAHLGQYIARVTAGESITICDRNKAVAELHPVRTSLRPRKLKLGTLRIKVDVPEDFNESLPEFESVFYGGSQRKGPRSK